MSVDFERIVREKERLLITGVSRSAWYKMIKKGGAPSGILLTARSVGWRYSELIKWINSRKISVTKRNTIYMDGQDASV